MSQASSWACGLADDDDDDDDDEFERTRGLNDEV